MTVQWGTTLRNTLLDQFEVALGTQPLLRFYSGAAPANCAAAATGTKLVEFTLDADWMAAAANGSKAMIQGGNPVSTTNPYDVQALAAGVIGYYRIYNNADTVCHEQGTVTLTGGGGDLTIDNTNVSAGQHVQITGYQKIAPGA